MKDSHSGVPKGSNSNPGYEAGDFRAPPTDVYDSAKKAREVCRGAKSSNERGHNSKKKGY